MEIFLKRENELIRSCFLRFWNCSLMCYVYFSSVLGVIPYLAEDLMKLSTIWMVVQMKYYSSTWYCRDYEVFHSHECSRSCFLTPFSLLPPPPHPEAFLEIFFPNCASLHPSMLHEIWILKNKIFFGGFGCPLEVHVPCNIWFFWPPWGQYYPGNSAYSR